MDYPIDQTALIEFASAYSKAISEQLYANAERLNGRQVAQATPAKQVNAFLVESIFKAWQQEGANLQSNIFNYEAPEVKERLQALLKSLSNHVSIGRDDFEPMLKKAVSDTVRFAFTPVAFIADMLAGLDKHLHVKEQLQPSFKYLKSHSKFLDVLLGAVANEGSDEVQRRQLLDLLGQLGSNGHLFDLPFETLKQLNATMPIAAGRLSPAWAVSSKEDEHLQALYTPTETMRDIQEAGFAEKLAHYDEEDYLHDDPTLAAYMEEDAMSEEEVLGHEERPLSEADLTNAPTPTQPSAPQATPPPVLEINLASKEDQAIIERLHAQPVIEKKPEPVVERVTTPTPPKAEAPKPEVPAASTPATTPATPAAEEAEEAQGKSLLEKLQEARKQEAQASGSEAQTPNLLSKLGSQVDQSKRIKGRIPLNLKFRFLNDLFRGSNADFDAAVDIVDNSPDYHTAITLLKEKFIRKYEWDLGTDTVREFLSMVDRRFE